MIKSSAFPLKGRSVPDSKLTSNPFAKRLIDVRAVAEMLGCGRSLVYQLIAAGELPVVKLGRLTKVPVGAVDEFIANRLEQAGLLS